MDTFSNLFTTLRNAQLRKMKKISVPYSQDTWKILSILENEGYIEGCKIFSFAESQFHAISEELNENNVNQLSFHKKKFNLEKFYIPEENDKVFLKKKNFPSLQKKILLKDSNAYKRIIILLKYDYTGYNGNSVIRQINRISKPGGRIYVSVQKLNKYSSSNTLATYILNTPKGILCDRDAKLFNVGGELLASIF